MSAFTFITWSDLEFKKTSGKEKLRCPSCDNDRSDKTDKSLIIYHNDGRGRCFYCDALTFKESNKPVNNKTYKLPQQNWRNYTELSDNWVKLIEERKIKQFSIKELGITSEMFYQPKRKKEVTNLVFNYFEGETLVNKKYRDSGKAFTQSAGTKSIFYNINSIIGETECYIVEGEFDVLAMHTYGVKNCISVPNGANDNDDYWVNSEPYLKHIEKFIIAVDNDEKGKILKDNIAQRLGRYRCQFIDFVNKDANGDLIAGILGESIQNVKRFPVSGTFTVSDLKQGMVDLYNNGLPDTLYPKHACWGDYKEVFSVMRGHLVIGTGIPSHGKSEFTEWLVLNLVNDYDMKTSFFSPEHAPLQLHQTRFAEKAIGRNFFYSVDGVPRMTLEDIDRYEEWANEKIYLTSPESGEVATSEWLLAKFKEHIYSYGTDIFVIDAFNKVQLPRGNRLEEINLFLTQLTNFAQVHNVVIFLIAHPTKMQKNEDGTYSEPELYDVSGSSDFRNQTHDGFCIYRHFDNEGQKGYVDFVNLKTKMKFQGELGGRSSFNYDRVNGRYYAQGMQPSTFDMTKPIQELQIQNNSDILPCKIDENDIPF
jgi:twinkle protein